MILEFWIYFFIYLILVKFFVISYKMNKHLQLDILTS